MTDRIALAVSSARRWQHGYNIFTEIEGDPVTRSYGPLAGTPIAVKDLIDHEGHTTTSGSAFLRDKATATAPAIARLEEAGATIIGRTGLHEFAFGFSSENPHTGPVRNPWDPTTSPGGSSGGSGAAVGAGIVPIAIGTDTGGSVRVPAALCGCYGLKVTYGKIPLDGVFPLVPSIDTVGPLADSIGNLELAYRAMSGDNRSLPTGRALRIGIPQPWVEMAPGNEGVLDAFRAACQALRNLGHEVHPVDLPDVFPVRALNYAIATEVREIHRSFREHGMPYGADVSARLDEADSVTTAQAREGEAWQDMIRSRFNDAFATLDLIMTPTVPALRKVIGDDEMAGTHYRKVLSWFTSVVNHALLPAIALPIANSGAPPASLQLVGPSDSEPLLLYMGRQLEVAGEVKYVPPALPETEPGTSR